MNRLVAKNKSSMDDDKLANDKSYSASLTLILIILFVSFFAAVGIAFWIIKSITSRIVFMSGEAEKIASREFSDLTLHDPVNDELKPIFSSLVNINNSFSEITTNANLVASGNYSTDTVPRSDNDRLGNSLRKMTISLRETTAENEKHTWLTTAQNQLNEKLRGDKTTEELSLTMITFLCNHVHADIGAVFLFNEQRTSLSVVGQYAFSSDQGKQVFRPGEGLIGQAALEQKIILMEKVREQDITVRSLTIDAKPEHIIIIPFLFEGQTLGVLELGKLMPFTPVEKEFLTAAPESIAISINSAISRKKIQNLLEETQVQSEELQSQQEELRQMNEELEEQAQNLKQQQEELQMTNEELEEQTQMLEARNKEVENARSDIEQKTKQLEISSKYKSEFLANMSHELRTPLNSLLILSRDLADNKKKNLNSDQVESAEIINKSGNDLLALINEVLDLSKIEAGKMTLSVERIYLEDFVKAIHMDFKHQADKKNLSFVIDLAPDLPETIQSDLQRLNQILKNILSNAIKFTDKGSISLKIFNHTAGTIGISVTDTGVGIPEEKQAAIFEAFQQADGGTSRKYGGTGLGLSISRELSKLLGGEIQLVSIPDKGSTFTLIIPTELSPGTEHIKIHKTVKYPSPLKLHVKTDEFKNYPTIKDDRESLVPGDKVVLIIEDDLKFATVLLRQCHSKGFKCISAATGEDGLLLAAKHKPQAIILDIDLPGINGHKVLAELKANPSVRHIPVHIVSVNERTLDPIKEGAVEYLTKPVDKKQMEEAFNRIENFISRKMKNLLIVEDDVNSRKAMRKLIGNGDVKCFEAGTGKEALTLFGEEHIDCIVLDIGLPDISGFNLIYEFEKIKEGKMPPIIIYTGKDLSREENDELQKYAETIIIKGVKSEERLLDETALFLHRTISELPESKQKIINNLYDKEMIFNSKKILVVDDDMRNVFALSKVLKEKGMEIIKAENGRMALDVLEKNKQVDLVLMDIMMPEMDGYEAMREIRKNPSWNRLPVIALTAKAMKEDRQKCIDAGANDYITKPVDVERLLTLMRVWLSK
jgi:CheY-like chemotaxis protein